MIGTAISPTVAAFEAYDFVALQERGPRHAFARGAGQLDASICGRAFFPGTEHRGMGYCSYCTKQLGPSFWE